MATNDGEDLEFLKGPGRLARGGARSRTRATPTHYRAKSGGGIARRVAIAQGRPQALLKVTSYGHGKKSVSRHASYISRKGTLTFETETGEKITGQDATRDLVHEWSYVGFGGRKNSRDTAHIVLGVAPGADRDSLSKAVRNFTAEAFDGHRYIWVRHDDTDAPHAHLMLKMRNDQTGKKLELRKQGLQTLREDFAAQCRAQGIEVDASRAWERGRAPRSKSEQIEFRRLRAWQALAPEEQAARRAAGYRPELDKTRKAVRAAKKAIDSDVQRPTPSWVAARRENVQLRQTQFYSDAAALDQAAHRRDGEEAEVLVTQAKKLREYADRMRETKTRQKRIEQALRTRTRGHDTGYDLER